MDARRLELEAEYEATLIAALEATAAGKAGLFGHNEAKGKVAAVVTDLCDRGAEIDELRERLGLEHFALHHEFEESRGPVSSQAPGEPKQARAWLERIAKAQ